MDLDSLKNSNNAISDETIQIINDRVIPKSTTNLFEINNKKDDFIRKQKLKSKQNNQLKKSEPKWIKLCSYSTQINSLKTLKTDTKAKKILPKLYKTNKQQHDFIKDIHNIINNINSEPSDTFTLKLESEINSLKDGIKTLITFKDAILIETNIMLSIIKLFLNDSIDKKSDYLLIFLFFENNEFIFQSKLNIYFKKNSNIIDILIIVSFLNKLSDIDIDSKKQILKCYQSIQKSNQSLLSANINDMINDEINKLEAQIELIINPKKFNFTDQIIFQKLEDSQLTNCYKKPWTSLKEYIITMLNLTVENFMYSFRTHLLELKNNKLDPRDLHVYEKVTFYPSFEFDEKIDFDIFIKFSVKKFDESYEIDWTNTDRLSNRNLLFFSLSPFMETIEAVATSSARKGTIKNIIIPILLLQGSIDVDKEYFMFEPIDNWNGPFITNLLNTNEFTFPQNLIKPIAYLDFSDNKLNEKGSLFYTNGLLKEHKDVLNTEYKTQSKCNDVNYYLKETFEVVKRLDNENKNIFLKSICNDVVNYLTFLENKRKKEKTFDQGSPLVQYFLNEIKKLFTFQNVNDKWIFDDFKPNEFKEKCVVDHEQYKALRYSLNHHLTLVNGAPGTGKTYLACELVKLLIRSGYTHQILIATYKNVSLDGFLDNVAEFLENNEVNFIRIGGKPRTEKKFILQNRLEIEIPEKIIQLKKQILYLLSLQVMINNCLSNSSNDLIKSIMDEIDKLINIKKILFNKFPFYSKEDELIITNFFNPIVFIPFGSIYFNCWFYESDYYESVNQKIRNELVESYDLIFTEFRNYLNQGENDKNTEIINKIIKNFFDGNEDQFKIYLNKKKKKLLGKDTSFLLDIINDEKEFPFQFYDSDSDNLNLETEDTSNNLYVYIKNEDQLFSKDFVKSIKKKFNQLIKKTEGKKNFFNQFLNELKTIIAEESDRLKREYENEKKEFEKNEDKEIIKELSTKKLIAMTATRASQYKKYLDYLDCKFMIIEEAGELTEPMAFSIIPKNIENLVMIGDYRQLRPTVEYQLTFKPYNHHISLFEKEVIHAKKIKSDNLFTLTIQRRMHPQIASLLRNVFYTNKEDIEQLNDDESTNLLKKPFGFPNHIQFWLHEFVEEKENLKMRSHVNIEEAKFCAMLFLMMLCRGYKSSEITIVPLYKGQKKQIENELINIIDIYYKNKDLLIYDAFDFENDLSNEIKVPDDFNQLIELRKSLVGRYVKCIDDFQGEENEVVILSLTRSEKPGFVKNENRSLVALSRARQMLFVIGNRNIFGSGNQKNPLWQKISSEAALIDSNTVNLDGIAALKCPVHKKDDEIIILNQVVQFFDYRFNCCNENCEEQCKCFHKCLLPCHLHSQISDEKSDLFKMFKRRYYCDEKCSKCCKMGHECHEICGNCMHKGCPPCSHPCAGRCFKCNKRCCLHCSHFGNCSCIFKGRCSYCKEEVIDLHINLKFWNDEYLICKPCFFKKVKSLKEEKRLRKHLPGYSNEEHKFMIYGDDEELDLSDSDDFAEYYANKYYANIYRDY